MNFILRTCTESRVTRSAGCGGSRVRVSCLVSQPGYQQNVRPWGREHHDFVGMARMRDVATGD